MKQRAFSLVEVLIAITIIGVIGLISSTILTRSFRAGTQTETLSKLKQNGDQAMNVMSEAIRNADSIVCYQPEPNTAKAIVIRTLGGLYTKFEFVDPVPPSGTSVTSNGYITKRENLDPANFSNFCTALSSPPAVEITNRTPTGSSPGVSISNGYFKKLAGKVGKDIVYIDFHVNQNLKPLSLNRSETVNLKTTIQVRGDLR